KDDTVCSRVDARMIRKRLMQMGEERFTQSFMSCKETLGLYQFDDPSKRWRVQRQGLSPETWSQLCWLASSQLKRGTAGEKPTSLLHPCFASSEQLMTRVQTDAGGSVKEIEIFLC